MELGGRSGLQNLSFSSLRGTACGTTCGGHLVMQWSEELGM